MVLLSGGRDLQGSGTPESTWASCPQLAGVRAWKPPLPASGRVVVVAPHPDDEVFGAGGTTALLSSQGALVELVAVTDGERSHPGREDHLRTVRPQETLAAAERLGLRYRPIFRLQHPDGSVDGDRLVEQLVQILHAGDLVLAPWSRDGHPDHEAVGRASARSAARVGASVLEYLVWAWHWADPDDLPWERARRVDLQDATERKREAAACFASQIVGDPVILPPFVRSRLLRSFEVLLVP